MKILNIVSYLIIIYGFGLILCLFFLTSCSEDLREVVNQEIETETETATGFNIDSKFPNICLPNHTGNYQCLYDQTNFNFLAIELSILDCPPCDDLFTNKSSIIDWFSKFGLKLNWMVIIDDCSFNEFKLKYQENDVLYNTNDYFYDSWSTDLIGGFPTTFFLDNNFKVKFIIEGYENLESYIFQIYEKGWKNEL